MRTQSKWSKYLALACLGVFAVALAGCGSSGGETKQAVNGVITGSAVKGPVANADITVSSIGMNGMKGELIAKAHTDDEGNFSVMLGDHSGPVFLEMSGGHYVDESTGNVMNVSQGDIMTSAIPSFTSGEMMDDVLITPLTSMAQTMAQDMTGGMTANNITSAHNAVGMYFDVDDILHTHPINPLITDSGTGSDQNMVHYGMALAAMSRYALDMNIDTCAVVTSFMDDVSDGHLDGMMNGTDIMMGGTTMGGGMMGGGMTMPGNAGTTGLADAMEDFIHSPMNRSGITITDMGPLMDQLRVSGGSMM